MQSCLTKLRRQRLTMIRHCWRSSITRCCRDLLFDEYDRFLVSTLESGPQRPVLFTTRPHSTIQLPHWEVGLRESVQRVLLHNLVDEG